MTSQIACEIYYSIAGEPFAIHERSGEQIVHTHATLYIYAREKEDIPVPGATAPENGMTTELSIPAPVKKDRFFNSRTYCLFLDQAGQVLTIAGQYLFPVQMMRDSNDPERLHIRFGQQYYPGKHRWEPTLP